MLYTSNGEIYRNSSHSPNLEELLELEKLKLILNDASIDQLKILIIDLTKIILVRDKTYQDITKNLFNPNTVEFQLPSNINEETSEINSLESDSKLFEKRNKSKKKSRNK